MIQTTDTSEKGLEALIVESLVSCADYVQGSRLGKAEKRIAYERDLERVALERDLDLSNLAEAEQARKILADLYDAEVTREGGE